MGDAVLLLEGGTEGERGELRGGFFQEPNFLWMSGWVEPGAAIVLAPLDEPAPYGDVLLVPDQNPSKRLWTGAALDAATARAAPTTGFGDVRRLCELEDVLRQLAGRYERILCLPGTDTETRLRQVFPMRKVESAEPLLAHGRMRKSAAEVEMLREAICITMAGQTRGWHSLKQCRHEYEVAADITHEFLRLGAERHAFAPIVACGANACALHYTRNRGALAQGNLTILDIGAERAGYCGDLTRTIPVGGRFTKRQRELYDAVLAVQKAILAEVRPGTSIARQVPGSLHQRAVALFGEFPMGAGSQSLANAFPHGIGHHLGMEVHDLHDPLAVLEPGMVITVEPGIYLPEEGIGIRIEDDVLVTEEGCELLSGGLAKDADEIEELLST